MTEAPRLSRPLRALIVAGVLIPLGLFSLFAWEQWYVAWEDAEERADRQARTMADHLRAVFQLHEGIVTTIADRLSAGSPDPLPISALHDVLADYSTDSTALTAISVIGPNGRPIANSVSPVPPDDNYADREFFQSLSKGAEQVIGPAIVGRLTGKAAFPVAHRISGPGEEFTGAVVSGIPLEPIAAFFGKLSHGPGESVTVARADGTVLLRIPAITTNVEVMSQGSGFMQTIAVNPGGGRYETVSELDRVERLHMVRPVQGHGIYASFGIRTDTIIRDWLRSIVPMAAVAVLGSLALAIMAVAALHRARGEAAAFSRWRGEVERRMQAEAALAQSQRLEAVGMLTGGVAHDVNNHLQVIGANLQLLTVDAHLSAESVQRIQAAQEGVERAASLTSKLLTFARQQPLEPKSVHLGRVAQNILDMLRQTIGGGIELETRVDSDLWNAMVDPVQVENAILNLAVNARDALQGQGKVTIEIANTMLDGTDTSNQRGASGEFVMLKVSDNGPGMSPDVLAHAFEPFFTTKPVGEGTGLGLATVHGFAKQSGGHVEIRSELGRGTAVTIYLPRSPALEEEIVRPTGNASGGTEAILVVEDEEAVRQAVAAMVGSLGYHVSTASNADEALSLLEAGVPADLIFTDVIMPGSISTPEFARRAVALRPEVRVLYTSGYTANIIRQDGRLYSGTVLLSKPYTRDTLARKLRDVLDGPTSGASRLSERMSSGEVASRACTPSEAEGLCVLLVEDEPMVAEATATTIRSMGHMVVQAASAEEALTLLAHWDVDVLLTDLDLPGHMDGRGLSVEARRRKQDIKVIFATGHRGDALDGIVLRKPYSASSLRDALAATL
ncbi:response regulator [Indioceanicola profundi]|uniref:response regulator n=1 Tax=Indioceanicola profundi TaxID=2220096 RepID=UPI000E6ABCF3|nr:response regulator [Indioceanicola profundi]